MFLLAERESQEEASAATDADSKMTVYDRIIKDCVDALQVVKEELKNDPVRLYYILVYLLMFVVVINYYLYNFFLSYMIVSSFTHTVMDLQFSPCWYYCLVALLHVPSEVHPGSQFYI